NATSAGDSRADSRADALVSYAGGVVASRGRTRMSKRMQKIFVLSFVATVFVGPMIVALIYQRGPRAAAHAFLAKMRAGERERAFASGSTDFRALVASGYTSRTQNPKDAVETIARTLTAGRDDTFTGLSLGVGTACMHGSLDLPSGSEEIWVELV